MLLWQPVKIWGMFTDIARNDLYPLLWRSTTDWPIVKPLSKDNKHLKNVDPIRYCEPFYIVIHQGSLLPPLSHAACASMSTTTTTTTTTTTRDRGDRYVPMEWANKTAVITYIVYKFGELPSNSLGVYAVKMRKFLPRFGQTLTTIFIHHVGVPKRIGRSQF